MFRKDLERDQNVSTVTYPDKKVQMCTSEEVSHDRFLFVFRVMGYLINELERRGLGYFSL